MQAGTAAGRMVGVVERMVPMFLVFSCFFLLLPCDFVLGQNSPANGISSSAGEGGNVHPRSLILISGRNGQPQQQLEQKVAANGVLRKATGPQKHSGSTTRNNATALAQTNQTPGTTTATQRAFTGKPGCQVDVVLLVDMSGGAVDKREQYLTLAGDLVRALDIGEFAAQVAFVRYSGKGRTDTVFRLKNRHNQTSLLDELSRTGPLGGTTRTKEAMLHARREFEPKFGGREKADRVMVVFTDGYSQDDPAEIAVELRRERIHVYAVAVPDQELKPNEEQLKTIASDPQSVVIGASQFAALKQRVAQSRCR